MQQQGNGYDCRIFAIAFATDIAYNHKPEQRTYNQSVMRKHLLAQLENETMTPFLQQTERVKRGEEVTHRFPFYQKCRVPFFEDDSKEGKGLFIAFCSVCENGTTRDVKIFLWSSFVTKKMCSMEMLKM